MNSARRIEIGRTHNEELRRPILDPRESRQGRPLRVAIYGSRPDGHAKVLVDLIGDDPDIVVEALIDDYAENASRTIRGIDVRGTGADLAALGASGVAGVLIGFGDAPGRVAALQTVRRAGLVLPAIVHQRAFVSDSATIEEGVQILVGGYVSPDALVSAGALINTHAIVGHDVSIGEGAIVNSNATVTGRARVGAGAHVAVGATVLPDCSVGDGALVGAGAVVTRDVGPGEVVAGVPARKRERASPPPPPRPTSAVVDDDPPGT